MFLQLGGVLIRDENETVLTGDSIRCERGNGTGKGQEHAY